MILSKRIGILFLILALSLIATPARANISGSTVNSVTPNPITTLNTPTNLCFSMTTTTSDGEYVSRFDVNLPDEWTINSVANTPSNVGQPTTEGTEADNVVYWQTSGYPNTSGAWYANTFNFCVNVTIPNTTGAPWNLPWNIIGENFNAPPHSVAGTISLDALVPPTYLTISKSVAPATQVPYQSAVTYTIALQNTGVESDTAVILTDTLPAAVDFGWWIDNPGASVTNDEISWNGTITNNTILTFTFVATQTGNYSETVSNTAMVSGTLQAVNSTATFTVEADPNVPPVLDPIGNQTVDELQWLAFTATATDPQSRVLTFTLDAGSAGTIQPNGDFTWQPDEAAGPGDYTSTIRVTNGISSAFETITITVNEINVRPIMGRLGYRTVNELNTLDFIVPVTDTDLPTNTLTYWMDEDSDLVGNLDPHTGRFTWTPSEADGFGVYTVIFHVSDGALEDSKSLIIVVFEVEAPPTLVPIGDKIADALTPFFFTARLTQIDIPTRPITYTLAPGSIGTIDAHTGYFRWTPGAAMATYTATIQVTDGKYTDTETIHLTVNTDTPGSGHWILTSNAGNGTPGDPPPFTTSNFRMVDASTNEVYGPFLDGQMGSEGGQRFDVAVTPDGRTALFSNFGDSTVFLVDMTTPLSPSLIASVTIPFFAEDIDISADGRYALVTDGGFSPRIAVIDIPSATLASDVKMHSNVMANAIEVGPDGTVIVANYFSSVIHTLFMDNQGRISEMNTYSYTHAGIPVTDTDHYFIRPVNVVLSPDGQTLLVCDSTTTTVGVFKLTAPGVLSFTGEVTGLHGTFNFYTNTDTGEVMSHGAVQSIAFNAAGDKAYAVVNSLMTQITETVFESGHRLGVLNITGPGQVSLAAGGVATLPHHGSSQLFGVDVVAVAGNKVFVGYPTVSGAPDEETEETNLAVVDLTDYSVTTTLVFTGDVSIATGIAALPLRLNLHQTGDTSSLIHNRLITYTLTLSNAGAQIGGLTLRDLLPAGFNLAGPITLDPPTAGVITTTAPEMVTDLTIPAYGQVTVTFPAQTDALTTVTFITNTARAIGSKLTIAAQTEQAILIRRVFLPLILKRS